jgi:hypothetical protein
MPVIVKCFYSVIDDLEGLIIVETENQGKAICAAPGNIDAGYRQ